MDDKIDLYLVYLVHIQQSINLSLSDKLSAFSLSVLNSYNLVPLIQKYNDAYVEYFHKEVKEESGEEKAKKEIDDFFEGKII